MAEWTARHGREPSCVVCDATWTLRAGHLHHRTYHRIGHETASHLIPLCRNCHHVMRQVLESTPSWRRLDRAQATDLIVAALRVKKNKNR